MAEATDGRGMPAELSDSQTQLLSFTELARRLPRRRANRPTHVSTLHRWRTRGVRGVRLEATKSGGIWITTLEAYQRFVEAVTKLSNPLTGVPTTKEHVSHNARVSQKLDAHNL